MADGSVARADDAARNYYDTDDVDGFYAQAWGGEDIHFGVYAHEREAIEVASRRTVERLAAKVEDMLGPTRTVLDMGSGYGGAARALAARYGCRVTALNISEVQNRRHRGINADRGLDGLIEVVTGSFNDIPAPDASFDVVWSQEALCHSGDRTASLREAVRVLKPGGRLVFTDILTAEDAPEEELRPLMERLTVADLATTGFYEKLQTSLLLTQVRFEDLSEHMLIHYERLSEEVRQDPKLTDAVSAAYLDRLRDNLPRWVEACRKGLLQWGIFDARRT